MLTPSMSVEMNVATSSGRERVASFYRESTCWDPADARLLRDVPPFAEIGLDSCCGNFGFIVAPRFFVRKRRRQWLIANPIKAPRTKHAMITANESRRIPVIDPVSAPSACLPHEAADAPAANHAAFG